MSFIGIAPVVHEISWQKDYVRTNERTNAQSENNSFADIVGCRKHNNKNYFMITTMFVTLMLPWLKPLQILTSAMKRVGKDGLAHEKNLLTDDWSVPTDRSFRRRSWICRVDDEVVRRRLVAHHCGNRRRCPLPGRRRFDVHLTPTYPPTVRRLVCQM